MGRLNVSLRLSGSDRNSAERGGNAQRTPTVSGHGSPTGREYAHAAPGAAVRTEYARRGPVSTHTLALAVAGFLLGVYVGGRELPTSGAWRHA